MKGCKSNHDQTHPSQHISVSTFLFRSTLNSSSWLCCVMRTLSAEVIQPLQAKQSFSVIFAFSSLCFPPSSQQCFLASFPPLFCDYFSFAFQFSCRLCHSFVTLSISPSATTPFPSLSFAAVLCNGCPWVMCVPAACSQLI